MTTRKQRLSNQGSKLNGHNVKEVSSLEKDVGQLLMSPTTFEEKQIFFYKKLVVPLSMRSIYWKCYGFPASEDGTILTKVKIVCLLCKTVIAYNRNTSNLRMHLQNKHAQELHELEMQAPPRKRRLDAKEKRALKRQSKSLPACYMYTTDSDGTVEVEKHIQVISDPNITLEEFSTPQSLRVVMKENTSPQSSQNQSSNITAFLMPQHDNSSIGINYKGVEDRNSISDAIADFVVTDLQLPNIVEAPGFQRLVATLRSPCEIPSKSRLVDEIIPKMYETVRDSVVDGLSMAIGDVSISVEEWTSNINETYVTFSVHYQQSKCEDQLQTQVLQTYQCTELCGSLQWGQIFDTLLSEWNLKETNVKAIIVATNEEHLLSALRSKGFTLIPCLMFTLQYVCVKGCFSVPAIMNVVNKVRAFLGLVFRNSNALTALRIQEHILQLEDAPLVSDYPKSWISTYVMLEQMLARRNIINSVIENIDQPIFEKDVTNFADDDWVVIEDIVTVLEPFKVTTMTLAEEKAPLVSLVKPLIWQIISVHLKVRDNDTVIGKKLKLMLSSLLKERFSEAPVDKILKAATTLDPRFKQLPYAIEEAKDILNGQIKVLLTEMIEEHGSIVLDIEGQSPAKKPRLSGMEFLLGDICTQSNALSIRERAELEIAQYQSEPTANLDHCPLTWWQKSTSKFPNLARLASNYNCIPASALPPNRIPVESQIAFDTKRSKLSPDVVDKLLFLNMNRNV